MESRELNRTSFQYFIFFSRIENDYYSLFTNEALPLLQTLGLYPRDLHQLINSIEYYSIQTKLNIEFPVNVLFLDDTSFEDSDPINLVKDHLNLKERIPIYFFSHKSKYKKRIISSIKLNSGEIYFYSTYSKQKISSLTIRSKHFIESPFDLIDKLKINLAAIKKPLTIIIKKYDEINKFFNFKSKINNEKEAIQFVPCHTNKYTTNQILSSFWESQSHKKVFIENNERQKFMIESCKELDQTKKTVEKEESLPQRIDPLIIISPFLNPQLTEHYKRVDKGVSNVLKLEQSKEYLFYSKHDPKVTANFLSLLVVRRLRLLDVLGNLLSSITYSPVIRLPLISTSIYKELAYFNPKHGFFDSAKANREKYNTIKKFGTKLSELTLENVTVEYIRSKPQIVAISDLPFEWLVIDETPLCLTHDICRIPEFNYQGILNHYSVHSKFRHTLSKNVINKTLVVLGANIKDPANKYFLTEYEVVEKEAEKIGYTYFYPNSIKELSEKIKTFKPEILIFDSHGHLDTTNKKVSIEINSELLDGDQIVKNAISAPIIYLSCCSTDPNFDYTAKINDAFFEAGALTITGTFLPISIQRGTKFYLRLLNMLKEKGTYEYFPNWLGFIAHIIRTSFIQDLIFTNIRKRKSKLTEDEHKTIGQMISKLMFFKERNKFFKEFIKSGIQISTDLHLKFNDTTAEFLMYSHFGRPDLIKFEELPTDNNR